MPENRIVETVRRGGSVFIDATGKKNRPAAKKKAAGKEPKTPGSKTGTDKK